MIVDYKYVHYKPIGYNFTDVLIFKKAQENTLHIYD